MLDHHTRNILNSVFAASKLANKPGARIGKPLNIDDVASWSSASLAFRTNNAGMMRLSFRNHHIGTAEIADVAKIVARLLANRGVSILIQNVKLTKLILNLLDTLDAIRVVGSVAVCRHGGPALPTRYDRNSD